jgi:hypothetical protein
VIKQKQLPPPVIEGKYRNLRERPEIDPGQATLYRLIIGFAIAVPFILSGIKAEREKAARRETVSATSPASPVAGEPLAHRE